MANAAFAQFAGASWQRWDWSVLNPGDQTSSTIARWLSSGGFPGHCSLGRFAGQTTGSAEELLGSNSLVQISRGSLTAISRQLSRVARSFHLSLAGLAKELRASGDLWLVELKNQSELLNCSLAAKLAEQSQRQAREYWSYYEDRTRWLGGPKRTARGAKPGVHRAELAQNLVRYFRETRSAFLGLNSLGNFPIEPISAVGLNFSRGFDWTALQLLELNERLGQNSRWLHGMRGSLGEILRSAAEFIAQSQKQVVQAKASLGRRSVDWCHGAVVAVLAETQRTLNRLEFAVTNSVQETVAVLSRLPVEAIGFVLPD